MSEREAIPKSVRFDVLSRDGFACVYCGRGGREVELHIDHVNPVCNGGANDPSNLVSACAECNLSKGRITPDEVASRRGTAPVRSDPLIGCWCHTFKPREGYPGGKILECQGQIIGKVGDRYLVQWFEWIAGSPTTRVLVSAEEMAWWVFYGSADEMDHSYRYGVARVHAWSEHNESLAAAARGERTEGGG